jgi:ABC-2 type transport system ATP-binding protein|nr:ATP-binding cassette domain-containing protein [Kofleriaceae bacterium]
MVGYEAVTAIEIHELSKSYGRIQALSKVSLKIEPGEVIGLLGPNGAGKTTLMKILTGYLEPDDGDLRVHGIDVVADPLGAQRRIGYLPESAPLYREMLVQEYLEMMAAMRGVPQDKRRARMQEVIKATGLTDRVVQPISSLSKGFRQRVGLAQAIIHEPDILILDEPLTGLDPTQIVEIRDLILKIAKTATVLLSTHILSEVEATCERVLVIMQGKLRADAKLADLRSTNAAVVAIEAGAQDVAGELGKLDGVTAVESLGDAPGDLMRWRVTSSAKTDVCFALWDALKARSWKVGELRPEPKTLERVFNDLAAKSGAEVQTQVPAAPGRAAAPTGAAEVER